jgi:hypothetical protein
MVPLAALSLLLAAAAVPATLAERTVSAALAVAGARAEVLEVRVTSGQACPADRAEALRPVTSSGEVALRLAGTGADGRACEGYAWARVRVVASGLVASRAVAQGELLQGAVALGDVELRLGRPPPLTGIPEGSRAARALAAGAPLLRGDVRDGPLPGEPITVLVRTGGLELSRTGRALPCARGRACALLPGGRRVEGRLEDGKLLLEAP